jgi:hypothetical protein
MPRGVVAAPGVVTGRPVIRPTEYRRPSDDGG